jgi:hypothetical protein
MQDRELSAPGSWSEEVADGQLPPQPASLDQCDLSNANRDEVLVLRRSPRDQARIIGIAATTLLASFVSGWAAALTWPEFATKVGLGPIAPKERTSPRTAERPGGGVESVRKPALVSHAPSLPGTPSSAGAGKTAATSLGSIQAPVHAAGILSPATQASTSGNVVALAAREPLSPAPETRPTTIAGWTVLDVRNGTAVLEGPDGIRNVARGDTIPGIGRVDSIVRWGNRWIVATANGLIAAP